jgi:hypothetical protein
VGGSLTQAQGARERGHCCPLSHGLNPPHRPHADADQLVTRLRSDGCRHHSWRPAALSVATLRPSGQEAPWRARSPRLSPQRRPSSAQAHGVVPAR